MIQWNWLLCEMKKFIRFVEFGCVGNCHPIDIVCNIIPMNRIFSSGISDSYSKLAIYEKPESSNNQSKNTLISACVISTSTSQALIRIGGATFTECYSSTGALWENLFNWTCGCAFIVQRRRKKKHLHTHTHTNALGMNKGIRRRRRNGTHG